MNERLINTIACKIVLVEGPGELAMTEQEVVDAGTEVVDGQALLASLAPDARLTFVNDFKSVTLDQAPFPDAPWAGMPASFYSDPLDAALWCDPGGTPRTYLFQDERYVRLTGDQMDSGYPRTIAGNWLGLPPEFEAGIDAAMWRPSNQKIYFFKGDQYVRLTGNQMDSGYPRTISGTWRDLPADFTHDLDAAVTHGGTGKTYLFKGRRYVRLTGTSLDAGYPRSIADDFVDVPERYAENIDAAMWRGTDQRLYLFGHPRRTWLNTYVRYADVGAPLEAGDPVFLGGADAGQTEDLWRKPALEALGLGAGQDWQVLVDDVVKETDADGGMVLFITKYPTYWGAYVSSSKVVMRWRTGEENFDRVLAHETGHVFGAPDEYAGGGRTCTDLHGRFFREPNGNCAGCVTTISMVESSLASIASTWHGLPADFAAGIDAALYQPANQRVYLFKGDRYARMAGGTMESGYPRTISGTWRGLPADFATGIDAALYVPGSRRVYLFKGDRYVRATDTVLDPGYPRPIAGNWEGMPPGFAAGIDAAVWRATNDKIYMFKGGQYVRLTGTKVDAGYPRPIAGNFTGLPASFTGGIDAALVDGPGDQIILFAGNQSARLQDGVPCLMWHNTPALCSHTPFHLGWGAFTTHVDAALYRADTHKAYLFSGAWCVRYSKVGQPRDAGYPARITDEWTGLPAGFAAGIDAAVWLPSDQKTYLFKGDQYCRLTGATVDAGFPRSIADDWSGLPAGFAAGIDAALWRANGKLYFFKGDRYVRLTGNQVDDGYPAPIAGNWPGLPASFAGRIDAAMTRHDTAQIYLFSGRRYARYTDVAAGLDPGYPGRIDRHWMPFPRD